MNDAPSDQIKVIPVKTPKAEVPAVGVAKAGTPTAAAGSAPPKPARPPEFGGPTGPEPTRYGDWERNGRVSDF